MKLFIQISRKEEISCAHRLHSIHLTDQENKEIYGKCNNIHGHGHNYAFKVREMFFHTAIVKSNRTGQFAVVNISYDNVIQMVVLKKGNML